MTLRGRCGLGAFGGGVPAKPRLIVVVAVWLVGCASAAAPRTSESTKGAAQKCASAVDARAAAIRLLRSERWASEYRAADAQALEDGEEWLIVVPTVEDQMPPHGMIRVEKA